MAVLENLLHEKERPGNLILLSHSYIREPLTDLIVGGRFFI